MSIPHAALCEDLVLDPVTPTRDTIRTWEVELLRWHVYLLQPRIDYACVWQGSGSSKNSSGSGSSDGAAFLVELEPF